jgi:hypothetical protein
MLLLYSVGKKEKKESYSNNRPWRPQGLRNVEAPTLLTDGGEVVSRMRWLPALCPQEDSWYSFLLDADDPRAIVAAGRIRSVEKFSDLIRNQTCNILACSILPQPTTPPRVTV